MKAPKRDAVHYKGTNTLAVGLWKIRPCPRCGAGTGQSCIDVRRSKDEGSYAKRLKGPHRERRSTS